MCCCKRKESKSQQEYKQRVADAVQRIESSLDVLNIIRNFNLLKVLAHLLLDERHFDLAQYVGFDLWRQEAELKMQRKQEFSRVVMEVGKSASKEKDDPFSSARVELEKKRFSRGLTTLKENIFTTVREFDSLDPRVRAWIDTFYYLHLLGDIPEEEITRSNRQGEHLRFQSFNQLQDQPDAESPRRSQSDSESLREMMGDDVVTRDAIAVALKRRLARETNSIEFEQPFPQDK